MTRPHPPVRYVWTSRGLDPSTDPYGPARYVRESDYDAMVCYVEELVKTIAALQLELNRAGPP